MKRYSNALVFLFGLMLAFSYALRSQAQTTKPATAVLETDDEVRVAVYKRFVDNRLPPHEEVAYEAAREYMRRYGKEDDQYTRYLKLWIDAYEKDDREKKLLQSIYGDKNFAVGYGLAKQVLTDSPDDLKVLIALGYGGYLATTNAKNEAFNADSMRYALKAIEQIDAGKAPPAWEPFKNRDDALSSLHYAVGFMELNAQPEESIGHLIKVVQLESDLKKTPSTYFFLATAYVKGPYQKLSTDYGKRFANQPETTESKAALANLNIVMDKIIDAYARAVALAGDDPKYSASKTAWMQRLTDLYKFRHDGSDAGLTEFIAGILSKPVPS